MKKKLIAFGTVLLIAVMSLGSSIAVAETSKQEEGKMEVTPELTSFADYEKSENGSSVNLYKPILDKYYKALKQGDSFDYEAAGLCYMCYSNITPKPFYTIGYVYYDVNGDGVNELIISDGDIIYDLYYIGEYLGTKQKFVESGFQSGERDRYYLTGKRNVIRNEGSGGASNSTVAYYSFSPHTAEHAYYPILQLIEEMRYDSDYNPYNPWMYSNSESIYNLKYISEAEWNRKANAYPSRKISVNSFSKYSALSAPTGVQVRNRNAYSLRVQWNNVAGASAYEVWRSTSYGGTYTKIATVSGRNYYINSGLQVSRPYYYKIRAKSGSAVSGYTKFVGGRTLPITQSAISVTKRNSTSATVKWAKSSGATGYEVWRSTSYNGKYTRVAAVSGVSRVDSGLKSGQAYYYKIRAYTTYGGVRHYGRFTTVRGVRM